MKRTILVLLVVSLIAIISLGTTGAQHKPEKQIQIVTKDEIVVTATFTPTPTPTSIPTQTLTPTSTVLAERPIEINHGEVIGRIFIPRFQIEAPVIVLGLDIDNNNIMESPDGQWEVAWYDFSALPGERNKGNNVVFAGHVDSRIGGPAVFWHLKDLRQDDIIKVELNDGSMHQYGVISNKLIDPDTVDINSIVGPTESEVITLITCGGIFNYEIRHYEQRVIVRAERIH